MLVSQRVLKGIIESSWRWIHLHFLYLSYSEGLGRQAQLDVIGLSHGKCEENEQLGNHRGHLK